MGTKERGRGRKSMRIGPPEKCTRAGTYSQRDAMRLPESEGQERLAGSAPTLKRRRNTTCTLAVDALDTAWQGLAFLQTIIVMPWPVRKGHKEIRRQLASATMTPASNMGWGSVCE